MPIKKGFGAEADPDGAGDPPKGFAAGGAPPKGLAWAGAGVGADRA